MLKTMLAVDSVMSVHCVYCVDNVDCVESDHCVYCVDSVDCVDKV